VPLGSDARGWIHGPPIRCFGVAPATDEAHIIRIAWRDLANVLGTIEVAEREKLPPRPEAIRDECSRFREIFADASQTGDGARALG